MDATTTTEHKPKTMTEMMEEIFGYWTNDIGTLDETLALAYIELCDYHNEFVTEEYREKIRAALKALRALLDFDKDLALALDAKLGQAINGLQERPLPDRLITIEDVNNESLIEDVKKERERRKAEWKRNHPIPADALPLQDAAE
jgi:hypothetical protein